MILRSLQKIRALGTLTFLQSSNHGGPEVNAGAYLIAEERQAIADAVRNRQTLVVPNGFGEVLVSYLAYEAPASFAVQGQVTLALRLPGEQDTLPLVSFEDAFDHREIFARTLVGAGGRSSVGSYAPTLQGIGRTLRFMFADQERTVEISGEAGESGMHLLFEAGAAARSASGDHAATPVGEREHLSFAEIGSQLVGYTEYAPVLTSSDGLRFLVEWHDLRAILGGATLEQEARDRAADWHRPLSRAA